MEGRIYQRGLGPAPWPKDEPFSEYRARVMGQHAKAALRGDYEAFNALTLVPMEKVDHPSAWASISEFLKAPKAARYPRPEDFAETRFGPL